jgi:ribosomal protein S18 acetylase RimI-like enzyme
MAILDAQISDYRTESRLWLAPLYIFSMASQSPCLSPIELNGADAADVASLYSRCSDYFLLQDGAAPTLADAHELFFDVPLEKDASDQTVLGWKGVDGLYAIAAILRNYPNNGSWYLGFMIVDAVHRGQGIGRTIYSMVENWAFQSGATEIRLAVLETNIAGERFWRSLGFSELRRVGPDLFKKRSHRRIEMKRKINDGFAGGDTR